MSALIIARNQDNIIGIDNKLPWHISADLKRFKKITKGYVNMVMGRNTFNSLGALLPERHHWVLTRNTYEFYKQSMVSEGVTAICNISQVEHFIDSHNQYLDHTLIKPDHKDYIVIGGAQIYKLLLPLIDKFYVTEVYKTLPKGKSYNYSYFDIEFIKFAKCTYIENHAEYSFLVYERIISHEKYLNLKTKQK